MHFWRPKNENLRAPQDFSQIAGYECLRLEFLILQKLEKNLQIHISFLAPILYNKSTEDLELILGYQEINRSRPTPENRKGGAPLPLDVFTLRE